MFRLHNLYLHSLFISILRRHGALLMGLKQFNVTVELASDQWVPLVEIHVINFTYFHNNDVYVQDTVVYVQVVQLTQI